MHGFCMVYAWFLHHIFRGNIWSGRRESIRPLKNVPDGQQTLCFMGLRAFIMVIAFHALTVQNMIKGRMKGGPRCHHAQKN